MIQISDNSMCLLVKDFDVMKDFMHYFGWDKIRIKYVTFGGFIKGEKKNEK